MRRAVLGAQIGRVGPVQIAECIEAVLDLGPAALGPQVEIPVDIDLAEDAALGVGLVGDPGLGRRLLGPVHDQHAAQRGLAGVVGQRPGGEEPVAFPGQVGLVGRADLGPLVGHARRVDHEVDEQHSDPFDVLREPETGPHPGDVAALEHAAGSEGVAVVEGLGGRQVGTLTMNTLPVAVSPSSASAAPATTILSAWLVR